MVAGYRVHLQLTESRLASHPLLAPARVPSPERLPPKFLRLPQQSRTRVRHGKTNIAHNVGAGSNDAIEQLTARFNLVAVNFENMADAIATQLRRAGTAIVTRILRRNIELCRMHISDASAPCAGTNRLNDAIVRL